jgi:hypothetical protein
MERRQQEGFGPIESLPRVTSLVRQYYGRILGAEIYILSSYTVEIPYIASWTPIHPAGLRHRMYRDPNGGRRSDFARLASVFDREIYHVSAKNYTLMARR